jgi:ribosome biogenesis GTPase A
MAKTRRQIKEALALVDAAAEVLDARAPRSSRNPELDDLLGQKPRIVLLNKADLADDDATRRWCGRLREEGFAVLPVDCRSGRGLGAFPALVRETLGETLRRNHEKGMPGKALRLMVVGIPNCGKSSFINRLAKRSRAETADRPGVTRRNQWYAIGKSGGVSIELLDTPGVLWPKFDDPAVGERLAFLGSIRDEILDTQTLALRLLEFLCARYPGRLLERYPLGITPQALACLAPWETLERIARKRGMLLPGGEADTARAAAALLDELRAGKLGKLTLE